MSGTASHALARAAPFSGCMIDAAKGLQPLPAAADIPLDDTRGL
jgi:hypothetical protein